MGAPSLTGARADIGRIYGTRFTNCGFNMFATAVPPGVYDIVVYGRSTVSGRFSAWDGARVVVQ